MLGYRLARPLGERDVNAGAATSSSKRDVAAPEARIEGSTPTKVLVVGNGDCGQLGLGEDTLERSLLTHVASLPASVVTVASKGLTCAALTTAGELFTWGCNDDGALGRGGEETAPARVWLWGTDGAAAAVRHVACGDCHTAAIDSTGALYTWGIYRDGSGQLGFGGGRQAGAPHGAKAPRRGARAPEDRQARPVRMLLGNGVAPPAAVAAVACGANHTAAIDTEGRLFTWGIGEQGQLGRRVVAGRAVAQLAPRRVQLKLRGMRSGMRVASVTCGSYHTFATAAAPHGGGAVVFAWGLNNHGQLGLGDAENRDAPAAVEALSGADAVVAMAAGEHHSVALAADARVLTFGRGDSGQLGCGRAIASRHTPAAVPGLRARAIACGGNHCLAVGRDDGALYTWGFGDSQQLANAAGAEGASGGSGSSFEERLRIFYEEHNPAKAGNVATIAAKYEGREEQLFAKLRSMYDVDSDDDGGAAADEWEPRRVTQAPLLGEGRVVCADGGGQHSVVLVETA